MFGFSTFWAKLVAVGAAIAGILAIAAKIFSAGKKLERAAQEHETLEVKDAQQKAAANSPRDRDGVVDSLQHHRF